MLKLFKKNGKVSTPACNHGGNYDGGNFSDLALNSTTVKKGANKITPQSTISTIYTSMAESLLHLGLLKKAEIAATAAIKFNSKNILAFQIRGECRYVLNQFKGSCADFDDYNRLNHVRLGKTMSSPGFTLWRTKGRQPRDKEKINGIHDKLFMLV